MNRTYDTALIIGGSKGMGLEIALALSGQGTKTHVVARSENDLKRLREKAPGIHTITKDASENGVADDLLAALRPDLLVLSAGVTPRMAPFQSQAWDEFSAAWNTDMKIAHDFMSAALNQPMPSGGTIVSFSSGAGLSGSRLSGGYAGAKRMQHFLTEYAQREADNLDLGLRFLSIIPKQLVQGTEKGLAAATAYAAAVGKPLDQFWSQWDNALTAKGIADHVVELLGRPEALPSNSYTITGNGIEAFS